MFMKFLKFLKFGSMKNFFLIAMTIFLCIFSLPSIMSNVIVNHSFLSFLSSMPKINLGLDLKGGSSITFGANSDEVFLSHASDLLQRLRVAMRKHDVHFKHIRMDGDNIVIELFNELSRNKVENCLKSVEKEVSILFISDSRVKLSFTDLYKENLMKSAINRSIDVLSKRIDKFGVAEASILSYGKDKILVQFPGVFDTSRIKKLLGKTAQLSFYLVKDVTTMNRSLNHSSKHTSDNSYGTKYNSLDSKIIVSGNVHYIVEKNPAIIGDRLVDAQVSFGQYGEPMVSFSFDSVGTRLFAELTSKNIGKMIAIVFDGQVLSAPVVNVAILGGSGVIQGNFSMESATELALMMRSGSLPTKLDVLEERIIGPGLGEESMKSGAFATILSVLIVMLCVFLMYKFLGIFVNICLFVNLLLTLSALAIFGITLTLPGVAGIALTIGMAVDANILINERIREDYEKVQKVSTSLKSGYERAAKTIFDSNITTVLGAICLLIFGSGPVRGFAITLIIGIVISIFTSVFLSRIFISSWLKNKKTLKI